MSHNASHLCYIYIRFPLQMWMVSCDDVMMCQKWCLGFCASRYSDIMRSVVTKMIRSCRYCLQTFNSYHLTTPITASLEYHYNLWNVSYASYLNQYQHLLFVIYITTRKLFLMYTIAVSFNKLRGFGCTCYWEFRCEVV